MAIPTDRLSYNPETKVFSSYLSDLRDLEPEQDMFEDGLENGVVRVKSERTGKVVTYTFSHRDMDGSNEDCYGYNYVPSSRSLAEVPNCRGTRLLMIND